VKISLPSSRRLSVAACAVQAERLITFDIGNEYLAAVECDRGVQGQVTDFRPQLALCLP